MDIGFSNVNPVLHCPGTLLGVGVMENWGRIFGGNDKYTFSIYSHAYCDSIAEDVPVGCHIYHELGKKYGVPTPVIDSMITLGSVMTGQDYYKSGLTLDELGIGQLDGEQLPMIKTAVSDQKKIAILAASGDNINEEVLKKVGTTLDRLVVENIWDLPEFHAIRYGETDFDNKKLKDALNRLEKIRRLKK